MSDSFERTVAEGLGSADVGGPWAAAGAPTAFSVAGGTARLLLDAPGIGVAALLPATASQVEVQALVGVDRPTVGNGVYTSLVARQSFAGEYRAKVLIRPSGELQLSLVRVVGGVETTIAIMSMPSDLALAPGELLRTKFLVQGTDRPTLRMKAWKLGTSEPAMWQLETVDTSPQALTGGGNVGVVTYLSSAASTAPIVVYVDDFQASSIS